MSTPSLLPSLRRLVAESGIPLKILAKDAGVEYQTLRRFIVGVTDKYNATSAEMVFYHLTGRAAVAHGVPLKRSLRKGRAA